MGEELIVVEIGDSVHDPELSLELDDN